jgi:MYXO-CTERM domain-containing protein
VRAESTLAAALLALAAALAPGAALAWADTPKALEAALKLPSAPKCDLCHHAASDPVGAVDQPFGKAMVERGLTKDDAASLSAALDTMRADKVDSDGDGAQDLDELSWGGDPNHADVPQSSTDAPAAYGCSAAPGRASGWGAVLALAAALAATRRRR